MSDSLGVRLRGARERRGLTVAEIATLTKISASLFYGLERDDVSRWPVGIYRRAFVRAYAAAVGLDPDEVVREFTERFPEPGDRRVPHLRAETASSRPSASMRLTLEDGGTPLWRDRFAAEIGARCGAALADIGAIGVMAVALGLLTRGLWLPLAAAVAYFTVGTLLLGTSPGAFVVPRLSGKRLRESTVDRAPAPSPAQPEVIAQPSRDLAAEWS
jgi:transcriptional regulator with XRE-family HTH domain